MLSYVFSAMGAAVALAGSDKLVGMRGYDAMFRHLGWSRASMQTAAAVELVGGLLMMPRATRRIGGVLIAATSASVLASEINHGDTKLAIPRGLIMLIALAAARRSRSMRQKIA